MPAFANEWYSRNMYIVGSPAFDHRVKTYGPQSRLGYKDFIPRLTAERFDPDVWADLFGAAGASYVISVAEHHDGFPMYDCAYSDWNAVKLGPRRNVVGELAAAVWRAGLLFGLSIHRAENWWFFNGGRAFPSDVQDPRYRGLYGPAQPQESQPDSDFLEDWLARTRELVEKYQPRLIYFNWWIEQPAFEPYLRRFAAYYYNRAAEWGNTGIINYKEDAFPEEAAVYDVTRGQLADIRPLCWQTDTSIWKNAWCYVAQQDYKSARSLVGDLVDIVSKNGRLLLNVGPRPDGTIPEQEEAILRAIGRWLAVNGEAIDGTRPWVTFGEGPTEVAEGEFTDTKRQPFTGRDIRFTTREQTLYAICLDWPGQLLTNQSLGAGSPVTADQIAQIRMLGTSEPLAWSQEAHGLVVQMPAGPPCDYAYTSKISLKEHKLEG